MVRRANLFVKMVAILFSLILVTLLFYGLSYRKDIGVITDQIKTTDLNHLEFLTQQMDNNINQLAGSMYALQRDPTIRDYEQIQQLGHLIDPAQTVMTVLEKLSLQTSSSTWENRIVLYKPLSGETLGSDSSLSFDASVLEKPLHPGWEYIPEGKGSNEAGFRLLLSDPVEDKGNPRQAELLMSMYFPVSNIERMFDTYQSQNKGDTFLYHPAYGVILSRHTDRSWPGRSLQPRSLWQAMRLQIFSTLRKAAFSSAQSRPRRLPGRSFIIRLSNRFYSLSRAAVTLFLQARSSFWS